MIENLFLLNKINQNLKNASKFAEIKNKLQIIIKVKILLKKKLLSTKIK